ncbi:Bestrophin, RFP-TM, chloride channel-domain-containing protein [Plectosphaerella plurivora]|uniref:Bestrophin, RFP-TM, chloride channel-domain-containing protein n=1 Tax=Plectosphaerella plurivora TaxID=936078 RepID=A0A9P9ACA7_9PEZI|nr:Bestrophin, RFP-TM, chloride channel-domain-containing protein [Plectosphaerella plurivora]
MSEEGGAPAMSGVTAGGKGGAIGTAAPVSEPAPIKTEKPERIEVPDNTYDVEDFASPVGAKTPNYFSRKNTSIDVEDYFTGPRDIAKHSKWPFVFQMHGSILPKLIIPLAGMGAWATTITCLNKFVDGVEIAIPSILLTVLGFVVGLGLSFRSSTAYERYGEGRRYWATLILATQSLGRVFWVHAKENPNIPKKQMMLRRVSCLNLLLAFSLALKHKLRFEPYTGYEDLEHLVAHLNTFAQAATAADPEMSKPLKKTFYKEMGEYLGVSFAESNPRKLYKKARKPLGNLPLEILSHLSMVIDAMVADGQLPVPMQQTISYNNLTLLNDIMTGTERVLNTPLPIAYSIAINQITWVYVFMLPIQLYSSLLWLTIPATIAASYIILGLLFIGKEIENPFGTDVNDLPLETYCEQIAHELDVIASIEVNRQDPYAFIESRANMPLYPISMAPFTSWNKRSEERIAATIKNKPTVLFESRKRTSEDTRREQAFNKNPNGSLRRRTTDTTEEPMGDQRV